MDYEYETIKTIRNLCSIAELLIAKGRRDLLPTIEELMFCEIQALTDEYCVDNGDSVYCDTCEKYLPTGETLIHHWLGHD